MQIRPGVTAIIGGGGKSTLLRALADALAPHARVLVATSTKMYVPDWCPVVRDASLAAVERAFAESPVVCAGLLCELPGKLAAPGLAWEALAGAADYVLVEADGSRHLPLKAHAAHEPVVPACASRVVCVAGIDGVGEPVSQACHRPQLFAQLAGVPVEAPVTPEVLAAVLGAEGLHDILYINKVESAEAWQLARRVAQLVATPVVAGSLRRGEFACLR